MDYKGFNYYMDKLINEIKQLTDEKDNIKILKKYELTSESVCFSGYTLYRIKALKSFEDVKEGDLGGFIESENNLSQNGTYSGL